MGLAALALLIVIGVAAVWFKESWGNIVMTEFNAAVVAGPATGLCELKSLVEIGLERLRWPESDGARSRL